jgi:sec-independent protein translocase protein TatB
MDIFGIGPLELIFILIIALIVIGPQDLGKAARSAGRFLNRLYRSEAWKALTDASQSLRTLPNRLAKEAALEELDEARQSVQETGRKLNEDLRSMDEGLKAWTKPQADESPKQDDTSPDQDDPADPPPE